MKIFIFFLAVFFLASCASIENNKMSYTQNERNNLQKLAKEGDAEAQYQLGNSWCCGEKEGFFSKEEAVKWWCKAASQGHEKAFDTLAQHQGDCHEQGGKIKTRNEN